MPKKIPAGNGPALHMPPIDMIGSTNFIPPPMTVAPPPPVTSLLARFPSNFNSIPFNLIGTTNSAEILGLHGAPISHPQDQDLASYGALILENGLRPRPCSAVPFEEIGRKSRSSWTNVLEEATWMANDVAQERQYREQSLKVICQALLTERMRPKKTRAAKAMEVFWTAFGGARDGRPMEAFMSSFKYLSPVAGESIIPPEDHILKPIMESLEKASADEKLDTLRRLDRTSELRSTLNAVVHEGGGDDNHPYFHGILSPVQSNTIRRLSVIGRHGLGAVLCDSGEVEHKMTVAALFARFESDLASEGLSGPFLVCGMKDLDLAYCRAYVSILCPRLRVVNAETDDLSVATFKSNDVVFIKVGGDTHSSALMANVAWGSVIILIDDATISTWTYPLSLTLPRPVWGGPIAVLSQGDIAVFEKGSMVPNIADLIGIPHKRLREVLASPPSEESDVEFPLQECLVSCGEMDEQRTKRKMARSDPILLEASATHAELSQAGHLYSVWRNDEAPPPFRSVTPSKFPVPETNGRRLSGKFDQALNLMRSGRCRRVLAVSSRRQVAEAFTAFCAQYIVTFQFVSGSLDARVAAWIRFLYFPGICCMVSRYTDLDQAPLRGLNSSVDGIILLDTFISEMDVSRLKRAFKHAIVFRLFTRGTIEQQILVGNQHPCLNANAGQPVVDRCELRPISRPHEGNKGDVVDEEEVARISLKAELVVQEKLFPLFQFAFSFSVGLNGATSTYPVSGWMSQLPVHIGRETSSTGKSSIVIGPLLYDSGSLSRSRLNVIEDTGMITDSSTSNDGPIVVLSVFDKKNANKKRKLNELEIGGALHSVDSARQLAPLALLENTLPPIPPASTQLPFSIEEDAQLRQAVDQGETNPAVLAEMLNSNRLRYSYDGTRQPPPVRGISEVKERLDMLQRIAERRDRLLVLTQVPEGDLVSALMDPVHALDRGGERVMFKRMEFWKSAMSSLLTPAQNDNVPSLDSIANTLPMSDKRLSPSQLLQVGSNRPTTTGTSTAHQGDGLNNG